MKVGFIGLGTMGASMASNLQKEPSSNEGMDEIDGILARGRAGSGRCCD